ncbi:MAG: hypothetical protein PF487_04580 [Bacteroidales bacterium]|jgi:hypothetical protein|nr:hypothetical protein [Bacteroidales bacterium]
MEKEREIEILKYRINELEIKIANFKKYNIDEKKTLVLEMKKLRYEDQLAELQLA